VQCQGLSPHGDPHLRPHQGPPCGQAIASLHMVLVEAPPKRGFCFYEIALLFLRLAVIPASKTTLSVAGGLLCLASHRSASSSFGGRVNFSSFFRSLVVGRTPDRPFARLCAHRCMSRAPKARPDGHTVTVTMLWSRPVAAPIRSRSLPARAGPFGWLGSPGFRHTSPVPGRSY
jgi:hypothetical protein